MGPNRSLLFRWQVSIPHLIETIQPFNYLFIIQRNQRDAVFRFSNRHEYQGTKPVGFQRQQNVYPSSVAIGIDERRHRACSIAQGCTIH